MRDLGVLAYLEPVGEIDGKQNDLVGPAGEVEVGEGSAGVDCAGDHFRELVGCNAGAVQPIEDAGEGGDEGAEKEGDDVAPCGEGCFALDVYDETGEEGENEEGKVPPHGNFLVFEHGLEVWIRLGSAARLLPGSVHVLAVEDEDMGDQGADGEVLCEVAPDSARGQVRDADFLQFVVVDCASIGEDGSGGELFAVAGEQRR